MPHSFLHMYETVYIYVYGKKSIINKYINNNEKQSRQRCTLVCIYIYTCVCVCVCRICRARITLSTHDTRDGHAQVTH